MTTPTIKKRIITLLKSPVYFLQIFTGAKSFTANPIIGSKTLNVLGLHVFRLVLAAGVTRIRYFCLSAFVPAEQRKAFHRDGFLLIKDYLPQETFDALNDEVRTLSGEVRECVQGDTLTQRILLTDKTLSAMPSCGEVLTNPTLMNLFKYTAAKNSSPIFYVQSIKSNVVQGAADPQRTLHSDTFHATMKAWLFLDNVSHRNGPFTYVAGSHRLTWKRLVWEYKNSVTGSELPNSYAARGSLRVSEADLQTLGLPEPTAFEVPANTLVIANTNGFHRRGAASEVSNRMELWAYSRTNPFNPFPGFGFKWYTRLSHMAIEKYLARQDRIAAAKGVTASWHLVDENALHEMPEVGEKDKPARVPEAA